MIGATKNYKMQQNIVDEFLAKNDPYQKTEVPPFDLRGYAAFIKRNNLKARDITPEMMEQFKR